MIAITPSAPGTVPRSNDLGGPDDLSGTVVRRSLVRGWRHSADAYRSDLEEHLRPLSLGALGLAAGGGAKVGTGGPAPANNPSSSGHGRLPGAERWLGAARAGQRVRVGDQRQGNVGALGGIPAGAIDEARLRAPRVLDQPQPIALMHTDGLVPRLVGVQVQQRVERDRIRLDLDTGLAQQAHGTRSEGPPLGLSHRQQGVDAGIDVAPHEQQLDVRPDSAHPNEHTGVAVGDADADHPSVAVAEHAYAYLAPSALKADGALDLATSGGRTANPHFFHGALARPRLVAQALPEAHHRAIDAVAPPGRPVLVLGVDGDAAWLDSAAIAWLKLEDDLDRNPKTGALRGADGRYRGIFLLSLIHILTLPTSDPV